MFQQFSTVIPDIIINPSFCIYRSKACLPVINCILDECGSLWIKTNLVGTFLLYVYYILQPENQKLFLFLHICEALIIDN